MRRTVFYLQALVAIVVLPSTARAQVFHGVVVDRELNKPVLVSAVTLIDFLYKVRAFAITDSGGRYELDAPEPGRYKIRVDARGYRTATSGEYIAEAGDTLEVNVLVTVDPDSPRAVASRRRALSRGCIPETWTVEQIPDECDGRWAVEVYNCFDQPINVYDNGEDETVLLGRAAEYEYVVLYSSRSAKPVTSVRHDENRSGFDFRERSSGLITVRVFCDTRWRNP
jgi:hypothetical protein